MNPSMQHCNGNIICAIDTETTGLDPKHHEIWQLAILPLTADLNIRKDILPLNLMIQPESLDYVDWNIPVFKKNKTRMMDAMKRGFPAETAKDLLGQWIDKLDLPFTKWGNRKRLLPLGHNYAFDKAFLNSWLGPKQYEEWFDYHDRDTMNAALYLNDQAAFHGEKVPFSKVNLRWVCHQLKVVNVDAHDALADCAATADCYRCLCQRGMFAF